jgi:SAM-dependent methyltransferase
VVRKLLEAAAEPDAPPVTVPSYAEGDARNPVILRREAFRLADQARGDRGLGPVIAAARSLVQEVPVAGGNPDVDTPADLATIAWARRVRANREQVDRVREVPDGADFYAPVRSLFRADPRRTDDPVLDGLRSLAHPEDVWLDIGAGAGRYALPLALTAQEVIALDPSAAMLAALRQQAAEEGITNVRTVEGRWPPATEDGVERALGEMPCADVALIAHVGYDVERIGPFVIAMEGAARRLCVAVLMERTPASAAEPVWARVHGEPRAPLPALPDLVALLEAFGRAPSVTFLTQPTRSYPSRDAVDGFLRRQLWIADGGEKERRFREALDELAEPVPDGWRLRDQPPSRVGIVTWRRP